MARLYFRKKELFNQNPDSEWVQMNGCEFCINIPENAERRFIDMGNVILEASDSMSRKYKSELDPSDYLRE